MEIITKLPKGSFRSDGKRLWGYYKRYKNGEYWVDPSLYDKLMERNRIISKKRRASNIEKSRQLDKVYYSNKIELKRESARNSYYRNRSEKINKMKIVYNNNKQKYKSKALFKKYGITLIQYNDMRVAQNFSCSICKKQEKGKSLSVDHCHKTGNIRGLLCSNCNTAIGLLMDDCSIIDSASAYVSKHMGNKEYVNILTA